MPKANSNSTTTRRAVLAGGTVLGALFALPSIASASADDAELVSLEMQLQESIRQHARLLDAQGEAEERYGMSSAQGKAASAAVDADYDNVQEPLIVAICEAEARGPVGLAIKVRVAAWWLGWNTSEWNDGYCGDLLVAALFRDALRLAKLDYDAKRYHEGRHYA